MGLQGRTEGEERRQRVCRDEGNKRTVGKANKRLGGGHRGRDPFRIA